MMLPDWFKLLGLMGWPLALCALLTLSTALERAVFYLQSHRGRKQCYQTLCQALHRQASAPKSLRDELIQVMLLELRQRYGKGLQILYVIGAISPMLGLLGTVLGIISTFQIIATYDGPPSPSLMASGLWEALLTTATGLLIALPALLLAHLFRYLSKKQLDSWAMALNRLSLNLELDKQGAKPASSYD